MIRSGSTPFNWEKTSGSLTETQISPECRFIDINLRQSCEIKKICINIHAIQKLDFAGSPTFQNYMFQIDIASYIRK
jgi:hypothetical protein